MDITHEILNIAGTFDRSESAHILKETMNTAYVVGKVTEEKYKEIIKKAVLASLASGVIPFSDAVIMSGIWGTMIVSLAAQAGHPFSMERAIKLAVAVLTGVATFKAGTKLFIIALHLFPGIGTVMAMGIDSFINALQTYRLGKTFAEQLERTTVSAWDVAGLVSHMLNLHPVQLFQDANAMLDLVTEN